MFADNGQIIRIVYSSLGCFF